MATTTPSATSAPGSPTTSPRPVIRSADLPADTPILVGVGQYTDRLGTPDYRALSAVDIAAEAARIAFADALSLDALRPYVDAIATTRSASAAATVTNRGAAAPGPNAEVTAS